jgi:hypothetical protein
MGFVVAHLSSSLHATPSHANRTSPPSSTPGVAEISSAITISRPSQALLSLSLLFLAPRSGSAFAFVFFPFFFKK